MVEHHPSGLAPLSHKAVVKSIRFGHKRRPSPCSPTMSPPIVSAFTGTRWTAPGFVEPLLYPGRFTSLGSFRWLELPFTTTESCVLSH
jgi:hypothetical protein